MSKEKHNHHHHKSSNIAVAFFLNFSFSLLEIVGGIFTKSIAIIGDAIHDLGDSLSLATSFLFEKKSKQKAKNNFSYGYKRLPVVGAVINIVILSVGSVYVIIKAIKSFSAPHEVISEGMFLLAIIGIIVNGIAFFKMKGSKKLLDKTVMLHLLEDLLGWIAVLAASIIIYFTQLYILDSILSLLISLIILKNIVTNIKESIFIIMQAAPDEKRYETIKENLQNVEGVESIVEFHMWTLDGEEDVITAKIKAKDDQKNTVFATVKDLLLQEGVKENTIEMV